jgi:hypothetical protein
MTLFEAPLPALLPPVPQWQRADHIAKAIARGLPRLLPVEQMRPEPVAVVCFGPSLRRSWPAVRWHPFIVTCSGAHDFLVSRGIRPTHHVDVDPRQHKAALLANPQPDVKYLIASCCHPDLFDRLQGMDVLLWHAVDSEQDWRLLPPGDWMMLGGNNVGLRALKLAATLGFRDIHVFGMDGCLADDATHAADHPRAPKEAIEIVYDGRRWRTTPVLLHAARSAFIELALMPTVKVEFHGDGLVQTMAKNGYREDPPADIIRSAAAFQKPVLLSDDYRALNAQLHDDDPDYGAGGAKHANTVIKLLNAVEGNSCLDYGCGKGQLAEALDFPIWQYDPCIPKFADTPRPADVVVCSDVLEHIEPGHLGAVLTDLRRCTKKALYAVIAIEPAKKTLPDGRNTHLITRDGAWWRERLGTMFEIRDSHEGGGHIFIIAAPKEKPAAPTPHDHLVSIVNHEAARQRAAG